MTSRLAAILTFLCGAALCLPACSDGGGDGAETDGGEGGDDSSNGSTTRNDPELHISLYECNFTPEQLTEKLGEAPYYKETVADGLRLIETNSVPNHNVAETPIAEADEPASTTDIAIHDFSLSIPVNPSFASAVTETGAAVSVGIMTTGTHMHQGAGVYYSSDDGSEWQYEIMQSDLFGLNLAVDCNTGHNFPVPPYNGLYHIHAMPYELVPEQAALTFMGWAADGFPIFARFGYSDAADPTSALKTIQASYRLKEGTRPDGPGGEYDGTFVQDYEYMDGYGDLDECNGREGPIEAGGTTHDYAYYITDTFPYLPKCLVGTVDESFVLGTGGPGGGGGPPPGGGAAPGGEQ
jgi:YHYH protein